MDGTDAEQTSHLPLTGYRVVEIGHSVAAPYAGLILAELGAEVIKVERPGVGDDARAWGPPFVNDMSAVFHALNRNKTSIEVDLKSPEGVAEIRALAGTADAVIQNQRPGLAKRLGIGEDVLCADNPRLVYASIHAFGSTGPLADRPGYDPLMQAFGGIMSTQGEPGRPSVRVGTSMIDMGTGMWTAIGILTALLRRETTGKGGVVDLSLYETALGWMVYFLPMFAMSGKLPAKAGSGVAMISPYQAFRTSDGELVIGGGNDNLFRKLCAVLGHTEWVDDARFANNGLRVENKPDLIALIEGVTCAKTAAEWADLLDAAGVPNAPVQTIDQVAAHPQTAALDILRSEPNSGQQFFGLPLSFEGRR
ncbi:MAG: CoA transferase, partial [Hyphomicrobiales bacterium]|nr:CoA transferase [Hyphomicrobiales bacterium]